MAFVSCMGAAVVCGRETPRHKACPLEAEAPQTVHQTAHILNTAAKHIKQQKHNALSMCQQQHGAHSPSPWAQPRQFSVPEAPGTPIGSALPTGGQLLVSEGGRRAGAAGFRVDLACQKGGHDQGPPRALPSGLRLLASHTRQSRAEQASRGSTGGAGLAPAGHQDPDPSGMHLPEVWPARQEQHPPTLPPTMQCHLSEAHMPLRQRRPPFASAGGQAPGGPHSCCGHAPASRQRRGWRA